jgi:hypothetical protein
MFNAWILAAVASIAEPVSTVSTVSYRVGLSLGPLALVIGSLVLMRWADSRTGVLLLIAGSAALTVFAVYNSILGLQQKPLQPEPPYLVYAVILGVMLACDVAVYKLWKCARSERRAKPDRRHSPAPSSYSK